MDFTPSFPGSRGSAPRADSFKRKSEKDTATYIKFLLQIYLPRGWREPGVLHRSVPSQSKEIRSREGFPSYKSAPFISTDAFSLKFYFFPTVLLLCQISQLVFFQNIFFYFFILNLSMSFFFRHDSYKQNTAAFQFNPIARDFHRLFVLVLTHILGIVFITLCC